MVSLTDRQIDATKKAIEKHKGKKEIIGVWTYHLINPLLPKSFRMDTHRCGQIFSILIRRGFLIKKAKKQVAGQLFVEYEA